MATTAVDPLFVDTNILVYSALPSAPFHGAARTRLQSEHAAGTVMHVSRQVLRKYLAVITRSQPFAAPIPSRDAADGAGKIAAQFVVADETAAVTDHPLDLLRQFGVQGKQVHDANIVATMRTHGLRRLLTNNVADFVRYTPLIQIEPLIP